MAETKTASLTVLGGPLAGAQCTLPENGTLTIGSSPGSTLHLDLPAVSPYHARILVEHGRITVHDTGSSRTVHVNDNVLDPAGTELRNGDILWLGVPGDDDVVMLQCILPKRSATPGLTPPGAAPPPGPLASAATPTPEIETIALWAMETAAEAASAPAAAQSADEDEVSIDDVAAMDTAVPEPELFAAAAPPERVTFPDEFGVETPVEAAPDTAGEPETYIVDATEALADVSPTLLMSSPDEVADAVEPGYAPVPEAFTELPAEPAYEVPAVATPVEPRAPREARPKAPSRPATRPLPPSASQRVRSTPRPAPPEPELEPSSTEAPDEAAPSSRRPMLLAAFGFVVVVALAAGGWFAWRTLAGRSAAPATTPAPVAQASEPAPPPPTAPEPEPLAATPDPVGAATPAPIATPTPPPVTGPAQAPPTPRPTPTPRATPTPSTAAPTPPPAVSGPSPEQVRAQQVAGLVGQAEAALASRQYDAALSHLDGALRLEPGNARATSLRTDVAQRRELARRRFVAGRTVVDSEKTRREKARGGLVGFDTDEKAPDFLGRIEFEMSPASGIEANDAWTLRVFVVNQGGKPIRIQGLALGTTINGAGSGGPLAASVRDIAPQQRVQLAESTGTWRDGTTSWAAEATLTAPKNETLRNTLTWK